MFDRIKRLFSRSSRDGAVGEQLERLRERLPVPVFWLFGKTQSGKTSVVKFLTGADDAEVGKGFKACTRFSRLYQFPTTEAPLLTFLDTRGIDEPGYDPSEDLDRFNAQAHLVIVTVKALDHGQEHVVAHLRTIRAAQPTRPMVLVLTCLHEAYPQQHHPEPYAFTAEGDPLPTDPPLPDDLLRSLTAQRRRFAGLVDSVVCVDLTQAAEGFRDPNYGGERLRQVLLDRLPGALRQTLLSLEEAGRDLQDIYSRHALPHILAYSSLAASAGALPVPFVDLVLISGIQSRMVYHLARLHDQPLGGRRFLELAGTLGFGILVQQATREMLKFIPIFGTVAGSIAGGGLASASTFALGKACCYYYQAVHKGHVPQPDELRRYYREQLALVEKSWRRLVGDGKDAPRNLPTGNVS
jgi:uncharacterized protein (DUF697 family)